MARKLKTAWIGLKNLLRTFSDPRALELIDAPDQTQTLQRKQDELASRCSELVTRYEDIAARLATIESQQAKWDAAFQQWDTIIGNLPNGLASVKELLSMQQKQTCDQIAAIARIETHSRESAGLLEERIDRLLDREIETLKGLLFHSLFAATRPMPRYRVETDHPIAVDSPDHLVPWGTRRDNSIRYEFNMALYTLLGRPGPFKVLDLGCAGGGFVQSIIEDGHDAVGVEGSNFSTIRKRGAWRSIPHRLFTCDITRPFTVRDEDDGLVGFDVITAWEVLEHIAEADLPQLFDNIRRHLSAEGLFICSVCTIPDQDPDTKTDWHQTVRPREWWIEQLTTTGFQPVEQPIIGKDDWLRGSGHFGEWHEDDGRGFHLVMKLGDVV